LSFLGKEAVDKKGRQNKLKLFILIIQNSPANCTFIIEESLRELK